MAFKIRGSHVIAVGIAAALAFWMLGGKYEIGGSSDSEHAVPIAEREADRNQDLFEVRYLPLQSEQRSETISIRGRTMADAVVSVRSETAGVVKQRQFSKGDMIKDGDLLCVLDQGAREAKLAQAKAQLAQAITDYEANSELEEKGFAATNRLPALQAAVDSAKAAVAAAEEELQRTEIRANASGTVQEPIAEIGDMLTAGGLCATLIDTDPMLFTGQVSERNIDKISIGMEATVTLVSGKAVGGEVRYVSPSADAATRTFEVEIKIDADESVRDGLTAEASITRPVGEAFRIAPSWVTLADDGSLGIRLVTEDDTVRFLPIQLVAQEAKAFWITGPSNGDRVITLGQDYVVDGERVVALPDERFQNRLAELSSNREATQ